MSDQDWQRGQTTSTQSNGDDINDHGSGSDHDQDARDEVEDTKEWRLIRTLVSDIQLEQVRRRRWGILFKSLTLLLVFTLVYRGIFSDWQDASVLGIDEEMHVAVIRVSGVIASGAPASADKLLPTLKRAFENPQAQAVLLNINSPGGSPVQAGIIVDEIQRLKQQYPEKDVYAVISDVGASGGYYIAAAADYIYADKASMVGSIGVIASGFGFTDLIANLGIERRAYTAGDSKDFLDPFQAEKPSQRQSMQVMLDEIHQQFIRVVKESRGARLTTDSTVFSGAVWNGSTAWSLGLLDGLGNKLSVARDVIGNDYIVVYEANKTALEQALDEFSSQTKISVNNWLGMPNLQ